MGEVFWTTTLSLIGGACSLYVVVVTIKNVAQAFTRRPEPPEPTRELVEPVAAPVADVDEHRAFSDDDETPRPRLSIVR